tara:strand:+ start:393 stop:623 length:231 start_codon:yes stop_codon:yes gene_type:complete
MTFNSSDYNILNVLKEEEQHVLLHANKYPRIQRKNVLGYIRLRIEALEQYEKDSEQAKKIINTNSESISSEQKNTE